MKLKLYTLLLGILGLHMGLLAQTAVDLHQQNSGGIRCDYSTTSGGSSARDMLNLLSDGNRSFSFQINYTQYSDLLRSQGSQNLVFRIWYENIGVSGLVLYKGFDVAAFLQPTQVEVTAKGYRGSERLFHTHMKERIASNNRTNTMRKTYCDTTDSSFSWRIESLKFNYDHKAKSRLRDHLEHIHAYEAAVLQVHDFHHQLEHLALSNPDPEHLEVMHNDLQLMGNAMEDLARAPFWSALPLRYNDPLELNLKFRDLEKKYQYYDEQMHLLLARIHILFYEKGRACFHLGQIADAERLALKSLDRRNDFLPAKVLMVEIKLQHQAWRAAGKEAQFLLNNYNLSPSDKARLLEVLAKVIQVYAAWGEDEIRARRYQAAIQQLDEALNLASTRGYRGGTSYVHNLKKQAAQKWVDEIVKEAELQEKEARRALETSDMDGGIKLYLAALSRIESAEDLSMRYEVSSRIDLQKKQNQLHQTIYQESFAWAGELSAQKKWDDALYFAQLAYDFTRKPTLQFLRDKAYARLEKIQHERYLAFIQAGEAEPNHNKSIALYKAAQNLDKEFSFVANGKGEDLTPVIQKRAKQHVLEQATALMSVTDNSKLNNKALENYAANHNIQSDAEVNAALMKLRDLRCANAQRDFDTYQAEVDEYLKGKDFKKAKNALRRMVNLPVKYPTCILDTTDMAWFQEAVDLCEKHQRLLNKLAEKERLIRPSWSTCKIVVSTAQKVSVSYQSSFVKHYFDQPACANLFEYLKQFEDIKMLRTGAKHYFETDQYFESFELFKRAVQLEKGTRGVDIAMQKELGTRFAKGYFKKGKDWKAAVQEHTKDIPRGLPTFERAFKRQWMKMERENR